MIWNAHLHLNATIWPIKEFICKLCFNCLSFLHLETFYKLQCVVKPLETNNLVYIYLSSVFMSADRNLCTCIDRVIEFEWKIKGLLGRAVMQWQHHISLCLSSYVEACWGVLFPLAAIGSWSLIFFFLCSWLTILVWCHVNPLVKLFWLKGKRPPIGSTLFTLWCISRCLKFGVSKISLRKLMLLLTNWSKATVKTYIVSTNISSKLCSFKLSNRQRVSNLEWFLKDAVTLE